MKNILVYHQYNKIQVVPKLYLANALYNFKKIPKVVSVFENRDLRLTKDIPLAIYWNLAHFQNLHISRRISVKCRICLVFHAQNGLLHLLESSFNQSTMSILY
jgi:hypothetical protein